MVDKLQHSLFTGRDIELKSGLVVRQPSIDEIEQLDSISLDDYMALLMSLSREPYEFKFELEDQGLDYRKVNTFDLFLSLNAEYLGGSLKDKETIEKRIKFAKMLGLVFANDLQLVTSDGVFRDKDNKEVELSPKTINEVKQIIYKMAFFQKPKERKPGNLAAKKFMKRLAKKKRRQAKKSNSLYDIYSIMSSLIWLGSGESYETITKRTLYQIYEGYLTIQKIKNYDNTMFGYFSGSIAKKDLDFAKLNWVNKVQT